MNMRFWRDWVLLWAAMPLFLSFLMMAFTKQINKHDPLAWVYQWGTLGIFLLSLGLLAFAPYFVLRRHLPKYTIALHIGLLLFILFALTAPFWSPFKEAIGIVADTLFQFRKDFSKAANILQVDQPIYPSDMLTLPWWKLYAANSTVTVALFAVPVLAICTAVGHLSRFFKVILCVILAGLFGATSDALFEIMDIKQLRLGQLNGEAWSTRVAELAILSVSAAIGGSVSAIGFNDLVRTKSPNPGREAVTKDASIFTGIILVPLTAALLWSVSYLTHYAWGGQGFRSGFAEIRRSLTSAPESDISVGRELLKFSHTLKVRPYSFPNANFVSFSMARDERSAVVREQYGKNRSQLTVVDLASGDKLTVLGKPLSRHEQASLLWSSDGRYLAVRTRGHAIKAGRYEAHETKLTLYRLPDYQLIAQWQPSEGGCRNLETSLTGMLEDSSGNLVLLCGTPDVGTGAGTRVATLSMPSLAVRHSKLLSEASNGSIRGGLIRLGSAIHVPWEMPNDSGRIVFVDTAGHKNIAIDDLLTADRGGRLTFQGFVQDEKTPEKIGLKFCGATENVANPPEQTNETPWGRSFCRIMDHLIKDGSFAGYVDGPETRVPSTEQKLQTYSIDFDRWVIAGVVSKSQKEGELIVREGGTNRVIQTLTGEAQVPIAVTSDHALLFTIRPYGREIAVYSIKSDP